jgi:putative glutamine amidotransferase
MHFPFDSYPAVDELHASTDPEELKPNDLLLVWGGEDISPALYDKPLSRWGNGAPRPSRRDAIEWGMMKKAKEIGVPIIGVCRGAQMLCALAGGTLYQHIMGHPGGRHTVTTIDGRELPTNSLHHQMMNPFDVKHEMLAWIRGNRTHYDVENAVPVPVEPEFVYFPEVKGFAVQWHPEMMDSGAIATAFIFEEMTKRI